MIEPCKKKWSKLKTGWSWKKWSPLTDRKNNCFFAYFLYRFWKNEKMPKPLPKPFSVPNKWMFQTFVFKPSTITNTKRSHIYQMNHPPKTVSGPTLVQSLQYRKIGEHFFPQTSSNFKFWGQSPLPQNSFFWDNFVVGKKFNFCRLRNPREKYFRWRSVFFILLQSHLPQQFFDRNSCSKNNQFGYKRIISTSQGSAANDGRLCFHI